MKPSFTTPAPADFGFDATVRSHGWYDLPPFRYDEERRALEVAVETAPGRAALVRLDAPRPRAVRVRVLVGGDRGDGARAPLEALVRSMLRLDDDLAPLHAALARPAARGLAADRSWVRRVGAGRLMRAPTAFEDAVKVLLTTNCTWTVTRGMVGRLVATLGTPAGAGAGAARAFPAPEVVARQPVAFFREVVRVGYRAEALASLARDAGSGALAIETWREPARATADLRAEILSRHGFGPYAADQVLRLAGRYDHPAFDSWMRAEWRRLHPRSKSNERQILQRYAAAFGVHAGLVLWLDLTRRWHDDVAARPWPEPK